MLFNSVKEINGNHGRNILRLFDTLQKFLFIKSVIISNKHGIYEFPQEL